MKRLASLLLALTLLLSLAACGGKITPDTKDGTNPPQSESNKDEGKTDENEMPSTDEETTDESETSSTDEEIAGENEIPFTEVVAVDNAECSIKITGIEPDNMWGFTLKAQLENKSTDKTYMFAVESAAINGVQCNSPFATEVAAGKKSNEKISFSDDEIEENGVGDYTDIELTFRVYDSNDWGADAVAEETIHVYPYGEDKAVQFVREAQASDNVLIDNEYVTVIVTGYEEDEIWGYTVNLFLLNKTDKNVMFSVDEASVNGFMANPIYATSVSAGKCAFSPLSWSDSVLEENGITEVEEIEFNFRAYNADDWLGDDFANETITLNP